MFTKFSSRSAWYGVAWNSQTERHEWFLYPFQQSTFNLMIDHLNTMEKSGERAPVLLISFSPRVSPTLFVFVWKAQLFVEKWIKWIFQFHFEWSKVKWAIDRAMLFFCLFCFVFFSLLCWKHFHWKRKIKVNSEWNESANYKEIFNSTGGMKQWLVLFMCVPKGHILKHELYIFFFFKNHTHISWVNRWNYTWLNLEMKMGKRRKHAWKREIITRR